MGCGSSSPAAAAEQPVVPQATTTPPQKNAPAKEASSAPPAAAAPAAAAPAPKPAPKAPEDTSTAKEPDAPSAPAVVAAPAEPEAGPGEMSDFQKAMLELEKVPDRVAEQMGRMIASSDTPIDKLFDLVRIINVQCLIRTFLARRRVARIKKEKAEGPSDYEKAQEELARLPPRFAAEVRAQMQKSDRPLHVIIKWSAIIIAQSIVRGYVAKKRVQKKKILSRTNSAAARTQSGSQAAAAAPAPAPAEAPAADAPPMRSLS